MPNLTVAAGRSVPASGVAGAYVLVDGLAGALVAAAAGAAAPVVGFAGAAACGLHALRTRAPASPAASRVSSQCFIDERPPFGHAVEVATRPYTQPRHSAGGAP